VPVEKEKGRPPRPRSAGPGTGATRNRRDGRRDDAAPTTSQAAPSLKAVVEPQTQTQPQPDSRPDSRYGPSRRVALGTIIVLDRDHIGPVLDAIAAIPNVKIIYHRTSSRWLWVVEAKDRPPEPVTLPFAEPKRPAEAHTADEKKEKEGHVEEGKRM